MQAVMPKLRGLSGSRLLELVCLLLIMKSVFRLAARRTICPRGLPAGIRAGK